MMLFEQFYNLLQNHEQVEFKISRKDNQLDVIILSTLTSVAEPDKLDADVAQIRSALSTPLRVQGTPEELEQTLMSQLQQFTQSHSELSDVLTVLEAAKQAGSKAVVKAQKQSNKTSKTQTSTSAISTNTESSNPETDATEETVTETKPVTQRVPSSTSLF